MQRAKKKVLITAPTGIAAITLGVSTLHRTFQIPLDLKGIYEGSKDENKVVKEADILIIDEISMVRKDVFEYVMKSVKSNNKKIQIIVTGDFFSFLQYLEVTKKKTTISIYMVITRYILSNLIFGLNLDLQL